MDHRLPVSQSGLHVRQPECLQLHSSQANTLLNNPDPVQTVHPVIVGAAVRGVAVDTVAVVLAVAAVEVVAAEEGGSKSILFRPEQTSK